MDRRDFIKLASCTGLSLVAPSAFGGKDLSNGRRGIVEAAADTFLITINGSGGWDPTSFCDPKGATGENDPNPMNRYLQSDIAQTGNIRYPGLFPGDPNNPDAPPLGAGIPAFFERHANELLVVNGIDMQTNGHDSGTRHTWSGKLAEGFPSMAAYHAATWDPSLPMSFLSFGGYSFTAGIAPSTRAGNLGALSRLAFPTRSNPDDEFSTFHSQRTLELIDEAQWHRDQALLEGQGLPKIENAINTLYTSRAGSNELRQLQAFLPEELSDDGLERQVQVAIAAYRAGVSVSCNLSVGGFDTHGDHDASHIPRLENLLNGISFALQEAERQGVRENVAVVAGSDFGRTPGYNDGNGKDHWSISSMLFIGKGIQGNRVVGETDEGHRAFGINNDLSIDRSAEPAQRIYPGHLHRNLRNKYMIGDDNPLAQAFPLSQSKTLDDQELAIL